MSRLQFRWDPSITPASSTPAATDASTSAAAGASPPPSSAKPVALPAPEYMSRLLAWVSDVLGDEARFPTAAGATFPPTFAADVRQIFRRLFRVYAHLYRHHHTDFERAGAVARNGAKLLGVGFGASLVGVGATNALIAARQFLDPAWSSPNPPQDVVTMSAAYASYMAISSNLRYQVIAGVVEERGIETLLAGRPGLCSALSFVVRTGNTFLGSLMWVDYIRLLGLQKG